MPHPVDSRDPSDWFRKGQDDLQRVPRRLQEGDYEDAAFHLQQALEKCLKGFLIARGWKLQRTHNRSLLLDEATPFLSALESHQSLCQEVSAFYVEERYPLSMEPPTREELEPLLQQAQQLINLLRVAK